MASTVTSQNVSAPADPAETITVDAFEDEARAFLEAHADKRPPETFAWGRGSDSVGLFPERTPEQEAADLAAARSWSQAEFDAGFGWITGPPAYGGRGLARDYQRLYQTLAGGYRLPSMAVFGIGLGMVAPTILAHATEEVKQEYPAPHVPRGHRGLPAVQRTVVGLGPRLAPDQSRAATATNGSSTARRCGRPGPSSRTSARSCAAAIPSLPKHRGLTAFVVDMHAAGVEVRPLRQMTGGASFNEVFFTDVRVPDSHRLGEVNGGWTVALTTLMNERAAIGGGGGGGIGLPTSTRLIELARAMGRADDPLIRQQLATVLVNERVARYTNLRAMARIAVGQLPGPEMSLAKLSLTANMVRTCDLVSSILGPALVADTGAWGTYAWSEFLLGVPGMRIAGGSDEVLHNIIGERVLGLPKDPAGTNN